MISNKEYSKLVKKYSHNSPIIKDCFNAFWIGGLICAIGQGFQNLYEYLGMNKDNAGTLVSITLIFLGYLQLLLAGTTTLQKSVVQVHLYLLPVLQTLLPLLLLNLKVKV